MDKDTHISIKPEYFIALSLALLILPFQWITAWIAASVFHELCHYAALRLCSCRVLRVEICTNGAVMDTEITENSKEILCALSGPFGSLLLILVGKWLPRIAVCGLFQCFYNLIPIYPLDGGRAVRGILRKFFSEQKYIQIQLWLERGVLLLFLMFGLYATIFLKLGLIPLVFATILIIKNKRGKYTCKERALGVK